jgi:hypothetical protein
MKDSIGILLKSQLSEPSKALKSLQSLISSNSIVLIRNEQNNHETNRNTVHLIFPIMNSSLLPLKTNFDLSTLTFLKQKITCMRSVKKGNTLRRLLIISLSSLQAQSSSLPASSKRTSTQSSLRTTVETYSLMIANF